MLGVLVMAGLVTTKVGRRAWEGLKGDLPVLTADDVEAAAGEGVMVGLLGGFRAVTADFLWVKTNALWEDRDIPGTQTMIRLVTTVDSRPMMFWINGARMIAYDMPVWRTDEVGGDAAIPATIRKRFEVEQAEAGLNLLRRGLSYHPDAPLILIEMGNIRQRRLGHLEGGAELYRRAALQPDAPYYAGRIYGEMLKQLGRDRDAYAWLVDLHRRLPANDPSGMAMPEVVLGRIRELEARLGVSEAQRYSPVADEGVAGAGGAP